MFEQEEDKVVMQDELTTLKDRAKQLGISHHPSIGLEKLKAKVNAAMQDEPVADIRESIAEEAITAKQVITPIIKKEETKRARRVRLVKEASRLVRVRVANMNPNKKEWEGDIYTVSNSVVGTFKKYLLYNAEDGWHMPNIIVKHLQERKCQVFYTIKNSRGAKVRKGKLIKELSIEILPNLTPKELQDLATRQAMANKID